MTYFKACLPTINLLYFSPSFSLGDGVKSLDDDMTFWFSSILRTETESSFLVKKTQTLAKCSPSQSLRIPNGLNQFKKLTATQPEEFCWPLQPKRVSLLLSSQQDLQWRMNGALLPYLLKSVFILKYTLVCKFHLTPLVFLDKQVVM